MSCECINWPLSKWGESNIIKTHIDSMSLATLFNSHSKLGDDINAFARSRELNLKYIELIKKFMERYNITTNLVDVNYPLSYKYVLLSILIEMESKHLQGRALLFQRKYITLSLQPYISKDCSNIVAQYL